MGHILAAENKREASEFTDTVAGTIHGIRKRGITTVRAIRDELNRQNIPLASGKGVVLPTVFKAVGRTEALTLAYLRITAAGYLNGNALDGLEAI